ncbi:hypothetical protein A3715_15265 [Oleiphilus sp. HI0009]|nr:hypothetical protein A3715_15265 [Oleiphilus sp. HI0009]
MSISEQTIDDCVHAVSSQFKINGVALNNDELSSLNDLLSDFVRDVCGSSIDDRRSELVQIAFDIVRGSGDQLIRIVDKDYDEDSIVEGLSDGSLATTLWHDLESPNSVINVATGNAIAYVVSQEVDGEYKDFR